MLIYSYMSVLELNRDRFLERLAKRQVIRFKEF